MVFLPPTPHVLDYSIFNFWNLIFRKSFVFRKPKRGCSITCACVHVHRGLRTVTLWSGPHLHCYVMCYVGSVSRVKSTFTFSTILLPRQSISYHYKYLENWRYGNHPFIYGCIYLSVQLPLENIKWEVT